MDFSNHPLNRQQYSTVNQTSDSTVQYSNTEILRNFSDLIPEDGYGPFYAKQLRELGNKRFIELANKARASSDTPQRLFCWMLKHSNEVR